MQLHRWFFDYIFAEEKRVFNREYGGVYISNMKSVLKQWITSVVTLTLIAIAVLLIVISFFLPPMGVVSPTVLQAGAEIAAFALIVTLAIGIDKGFKPSIQYKDVSLNMDGRPLPPAAAPNDSNEFNGEDAEVY